MLVAVAIVSRRDELERTAAAFWSAEPGWIALGIGIEMATVLAAGLSYVLLLRRLGYRLPLLGLVSVHLQRCAVGAVSPLSGPTSVCVFLHLLARQRVPTQDALLTVGLRSVAGQVAFILTLIVALALLRPVEALWLGGALMAGTALWLALRRWRPTGLPAPRLRVSRRFLPRVLADWLRELVVRVRRHRLSPGDVSWPAALAVVCRVGSIALLFVSLRAIGVNASLGTAVIVYLAALLAHATLPIFGGAGLVEGAATAALIQTGVPADLALVAALLWRLIDYWLPLAVGLVAHAAVLLSPATPSTSVRPASRSRTSAPLAPRSAAARP
jgi:uncharacterized membrane protein YbhN (UPF0104 family)